MAEFSNIGKGKGFIYVVAPDGLAILSNLPNNEVEYRKVKLLAIKAAAPSGNLVAYGSVEFLTVDPGSITDITVNSISQFDTAVNTSGQTLAQVAASVATEINGTSPSSGADYTALADGAIVYLFADKDSGSDVNGHVVAMVTDDADSNTSTDVNIANGHSAGKVYDEAYGYRFFLNDATSAVEGSLSGATEITEQIIALRSATILQNLTISNGTLTVTRKGIHTHVEVDTEGSASSDNLDNINVKEFGIGDYIHIVGAAAARVTTARSTGNLTNKSGNFLTADYSTWITYQLWPKGGGGLDQWEWFEIERTTQSVATVADFRTADIPIIGQYGEATISLSTSGTTTFTANTDKQRQILSGTVSLSGNLVMALSNTDAKAGDRFIFENNGKVTVNAYSYTIAGIVLDTNQALNGGYIIEAYYNGSAWKSDIRPNLNDGATRAKFDDNDMATDGIKVRALELNLKKDQRTVLVSFESGETGDMKVYMNTKGTINRVDVYVTKDMETSDDGSIIVKNAVGDSMGTITIPKTATRGNGFSLTPTSNNTFEDREVLNLESSKVTAGGKVTAYISFTRTSP